jgi:hypothetical protein
VNAETLLESLDRHFIAGCPDLSASQFREHDARGAFAECDQRAAAVQAAEPAEVAR